MLMYVLVENLLELPKVDRPQMFAHIKNKQFDLVVIENGKLLLCNSFSFINFILLVKNIFQTEQSFFRLLQQ